MRVQQPGCPSTVWVQLWAAWQARTIRQRPHLWSCRLLHFEAAVGCLQGEQPPQLQILWQRFSWGSLAARERPPLLLCMGCQGSGQPCQCRCKSGAYLGIVIGQLLALRHPAGS